MAIIAGQINPANYPQPDYSGVVRSAQMQAQGLADIGKSISGVIDNFGAAKVEQKKVDAYNKASAKSIEAAITLGSSYEIAGVESTLRPFLEAYNDPNLSPIEKAALLDEGKAMIPNVFGRFDQSQANAIQQAQLGARNAPQPRSFDFKEVMVPHFVNGIKGTIRMQEDANSGRVRTSDGKEYSNIEDAKAGRNPIGQGDNGIDAALNLTMPTLEQPSTSGFETAMGGAPGVLPNLITSAAEMPDGQGNLANASPVPVGSPTVTKQPTVDGPPGFVPDEVQAVEPETTARIITGEEASALNLSPENTYEVKIKNGKAVGYTVIDKSPAPMNEADKVKLDESSLRSAADAVYAINTINELTSSKAFSDVFGAGYGLKYVQGTEAYDAEVAREAIVALATTDSMRKFQGLGSMSDAEFAVAQKAATQIKQSGISEKKAAEELNRLRNYFSESIRRAEDLGRIPKGSYQKMLTGQTGNQNNPSTEAPMSATDRFRAKAKQLPLR